MPPQRDEIDIISGLSIVQTVISTLFEQHDLRLVALAAIVCALSAIAGMTLLHHARRTAGAAKFGWVAVAAISVGFGIWATHFVAMMAFAAGMPTGYDLPLTLLSLAIAVMIVGGGLLWATVAPRRTDALLAGAVVGIGISSMHYVGMTALLVGGEIIWDPVLVAVSLMLGMSFGALSLFLATARIGWVGRLLGALSLTVAICSMHFTAMGAAGLDNCYAIVDASDATPGWLSLVVAAGSILLLGVTFAGIALDRRERRRDLAEASRMRGLADAAVEGLLVVRRNRIVTANASFLKFVDLPHDEIVGQHLSDFVPANIVASLNVANDSSIETELRGAADASLPVEVIMREVDFGGEPHQAVAIRDLSGRKQAEQHIRFLAHHDPLTGLPNRASLGRALENEIALARRHQQSFAMLALDLDRFKEVNDLFGHPAGDSLLQRVANVLQRVIEGRGTAARLGGDEFALVLSDVSSPVAAGELAEQILDAFRHENETGSGGTLMSASIGISVFPNDGETAEALANHADTALYRAKQEGRGIYRFYEMQMGAEVRDRRMIEHELRHAVSRKQLRLVYQPQVDIQSGEVTGFEALVRWQHPERGNVPPAEFIPIAEESGLILQIGEWVLRTACAEAARWSGEMTIAINVSAVQLHAPNFALLLHEVLLQTGVKPSRLEIEITETALVRDINRAVATLRQIKALGVEIAMDDFGTGYSSLANLRAFPFSRIKVDRSFIQLVDQNEQSATIVRAVLGLGSGLNVPVVAEGVERPEELQFLRDETCQSAQGYLLGRPQPIETFHAITSGQSRILPPAETMAPMRLVG